MTNPPFLLEDKTACHAARHKRDFARQRRNKWMSEPGGEALLVATAEEPERRGRATAGVFS